MASTSYRSLGDDEIAALEAHGNVSEDWSLVYVRVSKPVTWCGFPCMWLRVRFSSPVSLRSWLQGGNTDETRACSLSTYLYIFCLLMLAGSPAADVRGPPYCPLLLPRP